MRKTLLISLAIMVGAVGLIFSGYTEPASSKQDMDLQQLQQKVKAMEKELQTLKDIEEIEILQKCYGYYIEHCMSKEFADLFADGPDVALHMIGGKSLGLPGGSNKGKDAIEKGIRSLGTTKEGSPNPEVIHSLAMSSGIVHVAQDGKTAKGRWYGTGSVATVHGRGLNESFSLFIYENDYIKQDGVWKFQMVRCNLVHAVQNPEGFTFVDPKRFWQNAEGPDFKPYGEGEGEKGTSFENIATEYPSGYSVPFHFKHPVTGKESSEGERNKALGVESPPGIYGPPIY